MSQPKHSQKPPSADATAKPDPATGELTKTELDTVAGGKAQLSDITITKPVDKSSPSLG